MNVNRFLGVCGPPILSYPVLSCTILYYPTVWCWWCCNVSVVLIILLSSWMFSSREISDNVNQKSPGPCFPIVIDLGVKEGFVSVILRRFFNFHMRLSKQHLEQERAHGC